MFNDNIIYTQTKKRKTGGLRSAYVSFAILHTLPHARTHTFTPFPPCPLTDTLLWDLIGSFQFTTELTAQSNYRHRQFPAHYWGALDFQTATPEGHLSSVTSAAEGCFFCWQAPLLSTCFTKHSVKAACFHTNQVHLKIICPLLVNSRCGTVAPVFQREAVKVLVRRGTKCIQTFALVKLCKH